MTDRYDEIEEQTLENLYNLPEWNNVFFATNFLVQSSLHKWNHFINTPLGTA